MTTVTLLCIELIPDSLKAVPQWVVWRRETRDGKLTKVPYHAMIGRKAASDNPSTWTTFEAAVAAASRYDGIGFVLTAEDPFVGVDLDHCLHPDGTIEPWALAIVDQLYSYTERSPSGSGLRIFVRGILPPSGRKKGPLELYQDGRFLTVTGDHLANTPLTIEDRTAVLQHIHAAHFPPSSNGNGNSPPPTPNTLSDEDLLDRMFASKNGEKIKALWNGDWSAHPGWTHSEADSALCHYLAFWCGKDAARMDRLFRRSGLMREKWDSRRLNSTYGANVIAEACERVTETYDADAADNGKVKWLADAIQRDADFAKDAGGRLYVFEHGVYRPTGEEVVACQVKYRLIAAKEAKAWSTHLAREVSAWLAVDAPALWECPSVTTVNVRNGLLDVCTGALRPHDPAFLSSIQLPVLYDPQASCPHWDDFINTVFPPECTEVAYELAGWLMLPEMSAQAAVLLIGEGANGKSKYLTALTRFLGKDHVSALSLQDLEDNRFATADLVGKLANICADLSSAHLTGTSMFKRIIGGDVIPGERKFHSRFEFQPFCRFVFSANHYPESPDNSAAFFRRWVVIPFERTFGPSEQRCPAELLAELTSPAELSGVLNRALDAVRLVQARGWRLMESSSMRTAKLEFVELTDPIAAWLDRATDLDPDSLVTKKDLGIVYNAVARAAGRPTISAKAFHAAVRRLRPMLTETKKDNEAVLRGIRLKSGVTCGLPSFP